MAKYYIISSSHYKKTRTPSTGVIAQEKGTKKQDDGVSYKQQQNTSTTSNNFSISLFRGIFVRRDQVPAPHIPVVDVVADGPISYERWWENQEDDGVEQSDTNPGYTLVRFY